MYLSNCLFSADGKTQAHPFMPDDRMLWATCVIDVYCTPAPADATCSHTVPLRKKATSCKVWATHNLFSTGLDPVDKVFSGCRCTYDSEKVGKSRKRDHSKRRSAGVVVSPFPSWCLCVPGHTFLRKSHAKCLSLVSEFA